MQNHMSTLIEENNRLKRRLEKTVDRGHGGMRSGDVEGAGTTTSTNQRTESAAQGETTATSKQPSGEAIPARRDRTPEIYMPEESSGTPKPSGNIMRSVRQLKKSRRMKFSRTELRSTTEKVSISPS